MEKYSFDYNQLNENLHGPKKIALASVRDQISRIAYDMVSFKSDPGKLWQIVTSETDGQDYIVAMYSADPEVSLEKKEASAWSVSSDKLNKNATVFYKNTPITSLNFSEIGLKPEDVEGFKSALPNILATKKERVAAMLNNLEPNYREKIVGLYPELRK